MAISHSGIASGRRENGTIPLSISTVVLHRLFPDFSLGQGLAKCLSFVLLSLIVLVVLNALHSNSHSQVLLLELSLQGMLLMNMLDRWSFAWPWRVGI